MDPIVNEKCISENIGFFWYNECLYTKWAVGFLNYLLEIWTHGKRFGFHFSNHFYLVISAIAGKLDCQIYRVQMPIYTNNSNLTLICVC